MSRARSQTRAAWLFLTPALGLIAVFFAVPVIAGLLLSLTDFDLYSIGDVRNARFVGIGNYAQVLGNPEF
ncbi:MAG: sugar ABC transporter permease, partial [Candidatus Eisenbacteria bacterium]